MNSPGSNRSTGRDLYPAGGWMLPVFIVVFVAAAWLGWFDTRAETYIDAAILDAGIIYAAARGINAVVSVIQSADVSFFVASLSPGEILDPINDLIERFSHVMTVSIASLALQKLLLIIARHEVFNLLLTVAASIYLLLRLGGNRHAATAFKGFVILAFIRISLALVVLANGAVDTVFIRAESDQHYEQLLTLESELSTVAGSVGAGAVPPAENESGSFLEWFSRKSGIADIKNGLQNVADSSKETLLSIMTLIAIMVLKTILLPVLFWVLLYRAVRYVAGYKSTSAIAEAPA